MVLGVGFGKILLWQPRGDWAGVEEGDLYEEGRAGSL